MRTPYLPSLTRFFTISFFIITSLATLAGAQTQWQPAPKPVPFNAPQAGKERLIVNSSDLKTLKEGLWVKGRVLPHGSYQLSQSPQYPGMVIIEIDQVRHSAPDSVWVEVLAGHVNLWPMGGTRQCGGARFTVQRGANPAITIRCENHEHTFSNVVYDGFVIKLNMDNDPVVIPDKKGKSQSLGDLREPRRGLLRGFVVRVDWW